MTYLWIKLCITSVVAIFVVMALFANFAKKNALADEPETTLPKSQEEFIQEDIEKFMGALSDLLKSIPRYGVPYMNENGDIIVPRRNPEQNKKHKQEESDSHSKQI